MQASNTDPKTLLRQHLRQVRAGLTQDTLNRRVQEELALQRLLPLLPARPSLRVGLYAPFGSEFNCFLLLPELKQRGVQIFLPRLQGQEMSFVAWDGTAPLHPDRFGILSPVSGDTTPHLPEVLIVPCLGFTSAAYRLGYGGGFYDRWLARTRPTPLTIGVAFDEQAVVFAPETHDYPLDYVVTPSRIFQHRP